MKKLLEKWSGTYLINHEVRQDLKDWKPKSGQTFKIRLLAKRGERK